MTDSWGKVAQHVQEKTIDESDVLDDEAGFDDTAKRLTRKERKALQSKLASLGNTDVLLAVKPRTGYLFRSDHFKVDSGYGVVLSYFHDYSASESFYAFWGVNKIPRNLPQGVSAVFFESVARRSKRWVESNLAMADRVEQANSRESNSGKSRQNKQRASKMGQDLSEINRELADGAAYLWVHNRILLKSDSLSKLDEAVTSLRRQYVDDCGRLTANVYPGEQRQELSSLFSPNILKRGRGFGLTSTEYAGTWHLVTNGITDPNGESVGYMTGDLNTSAVLVDLNNFMRSRHAVVCDSNQVQIDYPVGNDWDFANVSVSDIWGSKISQSCLLNNHKVVHLMLNGERLTPVLGPAMDKITTTIDLSKGMINMFEVFGDPSEAQELFPVHLSKIALMAEQLYDLTETERGIVLGSLSNILTDFYRDRRMWVENAAINADDIRLVGVPHNQVPRLQEFMTYINQEKKALTMTQFKDEEKLHAFGVLQLIFSNILRSQTKLFNQFTSDEIDFVKNSPRVIYDFAELSKTSQGTSMAQLVNVISFAIGNLKDGDTLFIHGAEFITDSVKKFLQNQFENLKRRKGRIVFLYGDYKAMLRDTSFNNLGSAGYTIMGSMSASQIQDYETAVSYEMPSAMKNELDVNSNLISFFRRNEANVIFERDVALHTKIHETNTNIPGFMKVGV